MVTAARTLPALRPGGAVLSARTCLGVLAIAAACAGVASLTVGAFPLTASQVMRILLHAAGLGPADGFTAQEAAVLTTIRLPRTVLAIVTGAGLAMAGAALQGLFRNPLADPAVIGVSSGAALGAALAIVGVGALPLTVRAQAGSLLLPGSAFVAALVTTGLVYRVGGGGASGMHTMLLAGIAFNAIALAGIGALSFLATDEQLRNLSFWTLGSLGQAGHGMVLAVGIVASLGTLLLWRLAAPLNALALGAVEAMHLGIDVRRLERHAVVLAAFVVGALVAATGVIAFVGLMAPHAVRLACGPDHRVVLPGAALFGATLLLVADAVARTVAAPAELPVGVLTTAVGAPFFLALLARARRASAD